MSRASASAQGRRSRPKHADNGRPWPSASATARLNGSRDSVELYPTCTALEMGGPAQSEDAILRSRVREPRSGRGRGERGRSDGISAQNADRTVPMFSCNVWPLTPGVRPSGPWLVSRRGSTESEVMRRIAAPIVGGMTSSTALTLLVIPALYAMVKGWHLPHGQAAVAELPRLLITVGP